MKKFFSFQVKVKLIQKKSSLFEEAVILKDNNHKVLTNKK